jgi:outer membrane receptor for ferrienterochelin and colicins
MPRSNNYCRLFLILLSQCLAVATAFSNEINPEESKAFDNLLNLLNTNIATGTTEQRYDLAPGVISIVEREQLVAAGVQTVSDALTLIPGFDQSQPQLVKDEPIIRGIGGIYTGSSGKIRYMVNGIVTNNSISANSSLVLQIPLEQIERIEIIRGPGSAIYGEYALLGVVNVVTNQNNQQLYTRIGGFGSKAAGTHLNFEHSSKYRSSFDLSLTQTDGPDLNSGTDILHSIGQPAASNAPGQPNLERRVLSSFYSFDARHWSASAFLLSDERGDGFGVASALSEPQQFAQKAQQYGVELKADDRIGIWTIDYRLAAKKFSRKNSNLYILPVAALGIYPLGLFFNSAEAENRYESGMVFSSLINSHKLIIGAELTRSKATDIFFESTGNESNPIPGLQLSTPLPELTQQPLGLEGRARNIQSIFISDQYKFNPKLEIAGGLRIDEYSDINESTQVSPRLSATYQQNENHVIKAQYSKAFRPPSFSELYYLIGAGAQGPAGNPNLKSETISTVELVHSYHQSDRLIRTTLFSSQIDDLIRFDSSRRFQNVDRVNSEGVEFEFEYQMRTGLKWFGNLSYINAVNKVTNQPLEGSTDRLGNIALNWQPRSRYSTTIRYQLVGKRFRSEADTRSDLDGYGITHLSTNVKDFLSPGLSLRLGIINLFDRQIYQPAQANTYANDYPDSGREIWLQLKQSLD